MESLLVRIVDAALPKEPVHIYDIYDEPEFIRQLRLWVRDKKKGPHIYPVHGYATISGTPFTMFRCKNGHTEIGEPYALPDRECFKCHLDATLRMLHGEDMGEPGDPHWQPSSPSRAGAYLREIGESEETISRTRTPNLHEGWL